MNVDMTYQVLFYRPERSNAPGDVNNFWLDTKAFDTVESAMSRGDEMALGFNDHASQWGVGYDESDRLITMADKGWKTEATAISPWNVASSFPMRAYRNFVVSQLCAGGISWVVVMMVVPSALSGPPNSAEITDFLRSIGVTKPWKTTSSKEAAELLVTDAKRV